MKEEKGLDYIYLHGEEWNIYMRALAFWVWVSHGILVVEGNGWARRTYISSRDSKYCSVQRYTHSMGNSVDIVVYV